MALQHVLVVDSTDTEYTGTKPFPVTEAVTTSTLGAGQQTTVTTTAGALNGAAANSSRKVLILQNTGSNNVRVSGSASVTATTGIQLLANGGAVIFEPPFVPTNTIYA